MPEDNGKASFEERINIVLDELALGIQWDRPSLIVIIYRSEHTKTRVQSMLGKSLKKSGQAVILYSVDKLHYDIPIEMINHPLHDRAVYFASGLRWGGGRGYSNAYRALNMHREYFIDGNIRAIFWLTNNEAKQLPRFAPDFWAFRHKVVEFPELPNQTELPAPGTKGSRSKSLYTNQATGFRRLMAAADELYNQGCLDEAILQYRKILQMYPDQIAVNLQLARINLSLGRLSLAKRILIKARKAGFPSATYMNELTRLNLAVNSGHISKAGFTDLTT